MKKLVFALLMVSLFFSCKEVKKEVEDTTFDKSAEVLKDVEVANWTILFDGTSLNSWKEYGKEEVTSNWKIEDKTLVFYPPKDRKKGEAYNLITKKNYHSFVLSLDWKISEAGNSGIFWGVHEDSTLNEAYQTGPEIQVLDNEKHLDAKAGKTHQAGALYDMVPPLKDVAKPAGEWNTCIITVNHKTEMGSVSLNGTEIVSFPVGNKEWDKLVSESKFADWEYFGKYTTGSIGLQDHGDQVSYRNIKIKEL